MIALFSGRLAVAADDDHSRVTLAGRLDQRVGRLQRLQPDLVLDARRLRQLPPPRRSPSRPVPRPPRGALGISPPP